MLSPDGSPPAASCENVVGPPQDRRSLERRTAKSAKRSAVPYIIVTPQLTLSLPAHEQWQHVNDMEQYNTARMYARSADKIGVLWKVLCRSVPNLRVNQSFGAFIAEAGKKAFHHVLLCERGRGLYSSSFMLPVPERSIYAATDLRSWRPSTPATRSMPCNTL